ncbi:MULTISPECIES: helix-turn-helix domain-containing protein [Chryseobacterium]|uniref:helix-turn-helix domain-containing protein n=1 Tax=Chryseobacterium TaxID=59732 RepID=UPI001959112F|nr:MULTISPECIES: AraC family transcriptional regulator [Chryseobacterium]MBM7420276.1 AraC-like DNA-binding protein [Chryseobacterium sp. JUb44]WSO08936.1 AraC family transcriptional regulator [Chryseobacterium scophthalmum]
MKSIFILLILLLSLLLPAQSKSEFDKVYSETYLKTSHTDFKKALEIADSLYSVSKEPYFKAKSLMLSATLFQEAGEVKKAVDYASKAEIICKDSKDQIQSAEIFGFLATQFRRLKLYDQSISYIDKATAQANQIEDLSIRNTILGLITQEHATYEIDQKNYNKAIILIEKSQVYFRKGKKPNDGIFLASNERLLGDCLYYLKQYDQSLVHYTIALGMLGKLPDNFLKGFIYNGIAAVYIKKGELIEAKKYSDLSQNIADKTQYLELKKNIYKTSQEYYYLEKNIEKFSHLKNKEDAVTEEISEKNSTFINNQQTKLLDNSKTLQNNNFMLILISTLILVILGFVFFFYYKKNILVRSKISSLEEALLNKIKNNPKTTETSKTVKPEVIEKILKKLDAFENSTLFIQKNISLSSLSTYCNTNSKYLSIVINTHKQKDFHNYINELRIKYLVDKIKTEPQYLKYKIVSLGELAGFTTQSKFIEAFKKEMLVTPSSFIKSIENQYSDTRDINIHNGNPSSLS